jgi:hypothetical protein
MRERLASAWADPKRRPALVVGLAAVLLAIVLIFVAIGQLGGEAPAALTPTPDCIVNCVPGAPPPVVPKVLHERGQSILISPVNVTDGRWTFSSDNAKAEWVYGTLINYVVGLSASQQNSDMLQALSDTDQLSIDLSNGQSLTFQYSGRQFVAPNSTDIFSQSRPGLTLVLLGENADQRLVVSAAYLPDSEIGQAVPGGFAQINTPVDVGSVRVTVLSARLIYNAPGIPVGSAFYLVDFTVEDIGTSSIDVADFQIQLQDYAKQIYKVSDTASQQGPYPVPSGQLQPGIAATFTSGFEVPTNVTGPVLVWVFSPKAGFNAQANVAVPLVGPTPTPDPRSALTVQITQAYFSDDQSEMIVVGGIGNPGSSTIIVNTSDLSLSTPEGILATLHTAEPPLPWNLGPGQSQSFTLKFSRLPGTSSILKILFSSFELNWQ